MMNVADIEIGMQVEGGRTDDDYDHGTVIAVEGDQVTVAWEQSQVKTTQAAKLLREYAAD